MNLRLARRLLTAALLAAWVGMVLACGGGGAGSGTASGIPNKGESGYLEVEGESEVWVAVNEAALDELNTLSARKDEAAIMQMIRAGRVLVCKRKTKVVVLDPGIMSTTIRIARGEHAGKSGVIPNEFLHRESVARAAAVPPAESLKHGLTEAQRKQVYWDYCDATYRAAEEADEKFGVDTNPDHSRTPAQIARFRQVAKERGDYYLVLSNRYYDEAAKKHGLTRDQLTECSIEGDTKKWPFRPRKSVAAKVVPPVTPKRDEEASPKRDEPAPAAPNPVKRAVKPVAASQFVGVWRIIGKDGQTASYFALGNTFAARKSHAPRVIGKWKVVGDEARITWSDGFRDAFRIEGGKVVVTTRTPGNDWDDPPTRTYTAVKERRRR